MHETSPGQVEEHELSIRSDKKSEFNGARTKTSSEMDEISTVKIESLEECDDERIYDDPCDLLDEVPILRMPKSRSWFCCPSTDSATQSSNPFYNRCQDYALVTEAPRIQFHTVGLTEFICA